jgi:hypothetical protein
VPSPRLARLTHAQWENTVRDLLRLPDRPGLSARFTVDSVRTRFDNVADHLFVDESGWSAYQDAAEELSRRVARDARALARLSGDTASGDLTARARRFVETVGRRAYRRPLEEAELARLSKLFLDGRTLTDVADPFAAGVEVTLQALLQSPHFLYRTELSSDARGGRVRLGAYEVASRLSYALAGTMPDDDLFAAAHAGELATAAGVRKQVDRLLGGPHGATMAEDFHGQLLQLGDYDAIAKDSAVLPLFVPDLRGDMRRETLTLSRTLLTEGHGLAELLTARHTFVNKRLAAVYGLPGDHTNDDFRRVEPDAAQRAGVLTHVGFLAKNGHQADSDPIHRGVFVAINVACKPLPPPVDDIEIPTLAPDLTTREKVEAMTGKGTCGEACHGAFINPPGFAFEHYDGLGRHRTTDKGKPVNAADRWVLDGEPRAFTNAVEFVSLLAASREVHECYAAGWLEYLLGRERTDADAAFVRALAERSLGGRASMKAIVTDIVTSDLFLTRAGG